MELLLQRLLLVFQSSARSFASRDFRSQLVQLVSEFAAIRLRFLVLLVELLGVGQLLLVKSFFGFFKLGL